MREEQIFETSDPDLVRKLHTIRAARRVFERDQRRWIISRIAPGETQVGDDPTWIVYGHTARYSEVSDSTIRSV